MRKFITAAALPGSLALALALGAPALGADHSKAGAIEIGARAGVTLQEVRDWLTAQGYEVRKGEMEDGKIEVYFVKDGVMSEIYVSADSGQITKVKRK